MKKLTVVLLILLTLTGCKSNDPVSEVSFNRKNYILSEVSSDGYDMFVSEGHLLEILYDDGDYIFSTEIDDDIYLVLGNQEFYKITKNGITVIIDGENMTATGSEVVDWNEDLISIMNQYKKAND